MPFLGGHRGDSWRTSGARSAGRLTAGRWHSSASDDAAVDCAVIADADGGGERVLSDAARAVGVRLDCLVRGGTRRPASVVPRWSRHRRVWSGVACLESRNEVVFVDVATGAEIVRDPEAGFVPHGVTCMDATSISSEPAGRDRSRVQLWRMSYPDGAVSPLTNDLNSYLGAGCRSPIAAAWSPRVPRRGARSGWDDGAARSGRRKFRQRC